MSLILPDFDLEMGIFLSRAAVTMPEHDGMLAADARLKPQRKLLFFSCMVSIPTPNRVARDAQRLCNLIPGQACLLHIPALHDVVECPT